MPRGVQNVVPNAFENSSQHSGSFGSDSAMKKKIGFGRFHDSTTVCEIFCSHSVNDG